ncbi:MAG: hypothetical protein HQL42_07945 [Alphaproteobacteria bacterium]|nr:hypothetical protein [Alphaproteobacteria bacterium]
MKKRRLFAGLGLALSVLSGTAGANDYVIKTQRDSDELLNRIRAIRYGGPPPALTGLIAAEPIGLAPPAEAKSLTTAYKGGGGCVFFFSPREPNESDLRFKWDGPPCDGKPISGAGTLTVKYTEQTKEKTFYHASLLKGHFTNGYLTGKGEKTNFSLLADGTVREDIFHMTGDFLFGVLNGQGSKTWTGSATARPSAYRQEGLFKDGVVQSPSQFTRLQPAEGIEAETAQVLVNAEGNRYLGQIPSDSGRPMDGAIFFTGDRQGWNTQIYSLTNDGKIKSALIIRMDSGGKERGDDAFITGCENWIFSPAELRCEAGLLTRHTRDGGHLIDLKGRAFRIPMPYQPSAIPFRIKDQELIGIGWANKGKHEIPCNEDVSLCRGQAVVGVSGSFYFWGTAEYRDRTLTPVKGHFMSTSNNWTQAPETDKKEAYCSNFASPVFCREGWFKSGGDLWTGPYAIDTITFEPMIGYNVKDHFKFSMEGNGRYEFSNGKWAEVYARGNKFLSVQECDDPNTDNQVTCKINSAGVMVFTRHVR